MNNWSFKLIIRWLAALFLLNVGVAVAAQQAGDYKYAKRYSKGAKLLGEISPDPDASGALGFMAKRYTYNAQGMLALVEVGELSAWQSETVQPKNWTGFSKQYEIAYTYNNYGKKLSQTTREGSKVLNLTHYAYDSQNRLECKAVRLNTGLTTSVNACSLGNAHTADGDNRITKYHYDKHGNLLKEQRALHTAEQQDYGIYTYDKNHNRTSVKDANGNYAELRYDGYNRLKRWVFPAKSKGAGTVNELDYEEYGYDNNGNRTYLRKRDGRLIFYTIDNLNRVIKKDIPGSSNKDVYYGYDNQGNETYARFASKEASSDGVTKTYDGFGRLKTAVTKMSGKSRELAYNYDKNGNRTGLTYPDNQLVSLQFDGLDRLTNVNKADGTSLLNNLYNAKGMLKQTDRYPGANASSSTHYGFDEIGRFASFQHDLAGNAYDVLKTYQYNAANQVRSAALDNDHYHYKGNQNLTGNYKVNGLNQYTDINGKSVSHDMNGNLTQFADITYVYDVENRLVSVSGEVNGTLVYDPHGRLFSARINGHYQDFVYDGDSLIAEYDSANQLQQRFIHGAGVDQPLIWFSGTTLDKTAARFLFADHQGSIIAISDGDGKKHSINTYDAYGIPSVDIVGRFGYTGQVYLHGLDLYYYKARIYQPKLGRFLQTDPIGYEDQVNLYTYVGNDPVNTVDPTGMASESSYINRPKGVSVAENLAVTAEAATNAVEVVDTVSDIIAPIKGGLKAGLKQTLKRSCCFVAGTQVLTEEGYKNIEDVKLGEKLWAKNTDTGEQEWKPVTRIFVEPDRGIFEVKLIGEDKFEQKIQATDDHPFYVVDKGWKQTTELIVGDLIETDGHGSMKVISVIDEQRLDLTYNFTVADFHTYYVTKKNVLVHNCNLELKPGGLGNSTKGNDDKVKDTVNDIINSGDKKAMECASCKLGESLATRRADQKRQINKRNKSYQDHKNRINLEQGLKDKIDRHLRQND